MSLSGEVELPIYMVLHYGGDRFTLVIDLNRDYRYRIRWEEKRHTFPITFSTLPEAQNFAEGWLDMIEAGGAIHLEIAESILPSGKDLMGFFALLLLLGSLVLLLYVFG